MSASSAPTSRSPKRSSPPSPASPAGRPAALRIAVAQPQLRHPDLQPAVAAALQQTVDRLAQDFPVTEVDGSALTEIAGTFDGIFLWEAWQVHRSQVERHPERYGPETLRLLRTAATIDRASYQAACRRRDELLPAAAEVYRGADVLLTPAAPVTAPATTPPVDTPAGAREGLFTTVFNLTGAPALVLPCGSDEHGLPVGLQLSAPLHADLALLAAATLIENAIAFDPRRPAAQSGAG